MARVKTLREYRIRRHLRIRRRIAGTPSRPRLCVYRSANHIYAQVIDDIKGHTIAAASTMDPGLKAQAPGKTKAAQAELVGTLVAERAKAAGVAQVVFDRGGFLYHGRVKTLADAARAGGLVF